VVICEAAHGEVINMDVESNQTSEIPESPITLEHIKHRIVVMSGKGGVGKSTVAANLALALGRRGYSVGLLDVDIHGPTIPKMLGVEDEKPQVENNKLVPVKVSENIKLISIAFMLPEKDSPIVWRGPMKSGVIRQFIGDVEWGELDYLVVDLPPGTGDEPLSIAQTIPESYALIVSTPQDIALLSVRKSINFAKLLKMPIAGIVENMSGFVCPHCGEKTDLFKTGGGERAADEFKIPFLGKIPIDPQIVDSGDEGTPFVLKHGDSKSGKVFEELVSKIEEFVKDVGA